MQPKMNAPRKGAAVPEIDLACLAAGVIEPESKSPLRDLQARRLTRRCAVSLAMAAIIAPLLHGEVAR
jgi:hypothetical protein